MQIIGSKTETDLLKWVSEIDQVKSFNDKKFKDGRLLIKLEALVNPKVVNWSLVTEGTSEEDMKLNAKYAISISRKLGAILFCVHDDITNLNKKMILIFVCALYDLKANASK